MEVIKEFGHDGPEIKAFVASKYANTNTVSEFSHLSAVAILVSRQTYRQKFINLGELGKFAIARDYYHNYETQIKLKGVDLSDHIIKILSDYKNIEYVQFLQTVSQYDVHHDNDHDLYTLILESPTLEPMEAFIDAFGIRYPYLFHDIVNELVWRNNAASNEKFKALYNKYTKEIQSQFFRKILSDKAIAAKNITISQFVGQL